MVGDLPTGITLDDPRERVKESPYTFEIALPEHIAAMQVGDLVKAIFCEIGTDAQAERMWAVVEAIDDQGFQGRLDSTPSVMTKIKHGDRVKIPASHVIGVFTGDGRPLPSITTARSYWDRCMADDCVISGRSHADYFYREKGDLEREGDKDPDSGWRIRGTEEAVAADAKNGRHPQYVALGVVLNADDRWIHLIDREVGAAFQWDNETQQYLEFNRAQ